MLHVRANRKLCYALSDWQLKKLKFPDFGERRLRHWKEIKKSFSNLRRNTSKNLKTHIIGNPKPSSKTFRVRVWVGLRVGLRVRHMTRNSSVPLQLPPLLIVPVTTVNDFAWYFGSSVIDWKSFFFVGGGNFLRKKHSITLDGGACILN